MDSKYIFMFQPSCLAEENKISLNGKDTTDAMTRQRLFHIIRDALPKEDKEVPYVYKINKKRFIMEGTLANKDEKGRPMTFIAYGCDIDIDHFKEGIYQNLTLYDLELSKESRMLLESRTKNICKKIIITFLILIIITSIITIIYYGTKNA